MRNGIAIIFCFFIALNLNAKVFRLNNNPAISSDFKDLSIAMQSLRAGDTLYAEGSETSYGDLIIDKKIVIIGAGYNLAENEISNLNTFPAEFSNLQINPNADGTRLMSLVFKSKSSSNQDVFIKSNDVTIQRCLFMNNLDINLDSNIMNIAIIQNYTTESILAKKSASMNNVLIANNIVLQSIKFSNNSKINIKNNIVRKIISANNSNILNNIQLDENITKTFTCGFSGNNNTYSGNLTRNQLKYIPTGEHNLLGIEMSSIFETYENDFAKINDARWKLKQNSPAKKYGNDGADSGIFGGSTPYVLSGLPPVPIIKDILIDNSDTDKDYIKLKIIMK